MDTINQCFIKNIIKAEENEKNINLVDFKISAKAVGDGNNVSSEVSRLYVNYEKEGKVIKKTYFMKIPSSSPLYHILKPFGIYEKECNMYTTVLPAMHKLLDEQERLSPKCYVTSDLKILILEDLRESGYKMINRRRQMDFDHATAALRTLAKFHAVSVKLNEMHPQIINLVKKDGFYDSKNTDLVVKSYERFLNIAQNIPSVEPEVYSKLVQIKDRIWDIVIEQTTPRENALNVLNHGDFWSNNMLFKYDHDGIKVKLVDFQLCRWSSPANDIIFMIINSVRFEVFEKKLDALLSAYHESFSYWLRSLKCNETYTLAELKKDFHNSYQYGYNVMASVLPLVMKKATDLNLNENVKNNKVNPDGLKKIFEEEKYIVAVTKWIHFYAKNDLFL